MVRPPQTFFGETSTQWSVDGISVGFTRYAANDVQPRHRHENPNFFVLMTGEFTDASDELGTRQPRAFDVLFHPAGAWHESLAGPDGRVGWNLELSPEWLSQHGLLGSQLGRYRVARDPKRALEFLRMALHGFSAEGLLEFVVPGSDESETYGWQRRLTICLHEQDEWTLATLAHELCVHPVYLARVFRARFGMSVTDYHLQKRLLRAVSELTHQSPAISAMEAGFADQSHLGRQLRRTLGVTPGHFAKKFQSF